MLLILIKICYTEVVSVMSLLSELFSEEELLLYPRLKEVRKYFWSYFSRLVT